MQEAMDRRDPHGARVPLDDVLVELAPDGYEESFEADGLDVGMGGLSMRASFLPDVGAKLRCRFTSPHDGVYVDADCEVVWADDSGAHLGEFGLRFTELEGEDADAIGRLVDAWSKQLAADLDPETEPGVVALKLEGVAQRVEATVLHDTHDALLVEQALPFLTIGTGVTEGGRQGILAAVDLRIDGDVPKLVLTIGFDDVEPAETTLLEAPSPASAADLASMDAHDMRDDAFDSGDSGLADQDLDDDSMDDSMDDVVAGPALADAPKKPVVEGREANFSRSFKLETPDPAETAQGPDSVDAEIAALKSRPGIELMSKAKAAVPKVKAWMVLLWAKTLPLCRRYWARTRHLAGSLRRRVGPALGQAKSKMRRQKSEATRTPKRRRTTRPAPAPSSDARPGASAETQAPKKRRYGRYVLVAVVFAAVAFVAWPTQASPAATANFAKILPPSPTDPEMGDTGFDSGFDTTDAADGPTAAELAGDVEPETPRAMPEPSRRAGPLSSLQGGARPSAAPRTVPNDSPYAAEPAPAGERRFGDESPRGPQFRIRMGQPIAGLRGTRTSEGFEVVVPGNRAAEGARRIASVHPRVARAQINNDAAGATLQIRFVGEAPKFEVRAAGDALLITIER